MVAKRDISVEVLIFICFLLLVIYGLLFNSTVATAALTSAMAAGLVLVFLKLYGCVERPSAERHDAERHDAERLSVGPSADYYDEKRYKELREAERHYSPNESPYQHHDNSHEHFSVGHGERPAWRGDVNCDADPSCDADPEETDAVIGGDEALADNSLSRNDHCRAIDGTMQRKKNIEQYFSEELEDAEDSQWWGRADY